MLEVPPGRFVKAFSWHMPGRKCHLSLSSFLALQFHRCWGQWTQASKLSSGARWSLHKLDKSEMDPLQPCYLASDSPHFLMSQSWFAPAELWLASVELASMPPDKHTKRRQQGSSSVLNSRTVKYLNSH